MAKFPQVFFYNLNGKPASLAGIGTLTQYVQKFSYKYVETEADVGNVILGFTRKDIDLTFLKPGIAFIIKWGYVKGLMSNPRTVVTTEADYKYNKAGFIVSLKFTDAVSYDGEGTPVDPDGQLIEDVVKDATKAVGVVSFTYTHKSGAKAVFSRYTDGKKTHQAFDESGTEILPKLSKADYFSIHPDAEERERWFNTYRSIYGIRLKDVGENNEAILYDFDEIPRSYMITGQTLLEALNPVLRNRGLNFHAKTRDGVVSLEPIDWGAQPDFGVVLNAGVISFQLEDSGEEARVLESKSSTIDPLTKEIKTSVVVVGGTFYYYALTRAGNIDETTPPTNDFLTKAKYFKDGDDYYMQKVGNFEAGVIDEKVYNERLTGAIALQELREIKGWDEEKFIETIRGGKDPIEVQKALEREREAQAQKRIGHWGTRAGDGQYECVTVRYSGRTFEDLKNQNIQKEMDKLFYHLKLNLKTEGHPPVESNNNFSFLAGNPDIDGVYHIDESEHTISSAGYTTTILAFKVTEGYDQITKDITTKTHEGIKELDPKLTSEDNRLDNMNNLAGAIGYLQEMAPHLAPDKTAILKTSRNLSSRTTPSAYIGLEKFGKSIKQQKYRQVFDAEKDGIPKDDPPTDLDTPVGDLEFDFEGPQQ